MLKKVFSKKKKESSGSTSVTSSLYQLQETLTRLEEKENELQKKISVEKEKAKVYMKAGNRKAALKCLEKKKLYEIEIDKLRNFQLKLHGQIYTLEGAKATTDTIDALKAGTAAVKSLQKPLSIDKVSKAMEEVNEQAESMKEFQEALANSIGIGDDFDEDELEAELEELEQLEETGVEKAEEVLQSSATSNVAEKENLKEENNVDELDAALQKEMAL